MSDLALARHNMVESQVRPNGITDPRIIAAMAAVAREEFVPPAMHDLAYMGTEVPLGGGRRLMEPMAFARLVQLADIAEGEKVLLIGGALGYGAAVLGQLGAQVVMLESDGALAAAARKNLAGLANVHVAEGALKDGAAGQGPFDVILLEGRVSTVPEHLFTQLKEGGRLVTAVGDHSTAKCCRAELDDGSHSLRQAFEVSVPPLPGFERPQPGFTF
jgi:protein-L-isoaspartate(D-aspartate) O-methyltransferase